MEDTYKLLKKLAKHGNFHFRGVYSMHQAMQHRDVPVDRDLEKAIVDGLIQGNFHSRMSYSYARSPDGSINVTGSYVRFMDGYVLVLRERPPSERAHPGRFTLVARVAVNPRILRYIPNLHLNIPIPPPY